MGPVVVLGQSRKRGVERAVAETRELLASLFGVALVDLEGGADLSRVDAEWAIVFGGDGAILNAARRMGDRPLPTLAVNFGRLGFLTEVEFKQFRTALERVKEGRIHLRERMRLTASVGDWSYEALNDVVVTGQRTGRVFHVSARIGGKEAFRYAGDGVVVATPTGSTAYSLAAGGPILDPELKAIVITPLCAHALSTRPLVIPSTQEVELYIRRKDDPPGRVVLDGQQSREIAPDEVVRIRRAEKPFVFIRVGVRSYFARMRRLLGWGGAPKYR